MTGSDGAMRGSTVNSGNCKRDGAESVLEQPHIQALKEEKFDLIIMSTFFNYCFLSFVHHFKVPFIYAWTTTLFGVFHDMIGNIDVPAISGFMYSETSFPFTFKQRLETAILNAIFKHSNEMNLEPKMHSMCIERRMCPPDTPPFSEFHKNASLIIVNSIRALEYPPRPSMPNVIYAGGAHLKPSKKLPKLN
ncbi:hypothetical protein Anas_01645 [Armadillidium nasatum]|uniref:Uncharacterized protein n=1 Tax=Armadillidium nasatum TaxID=96803 RepID=A0A5N5TJ63_9CRUS|nr:hypothetical protein Anas_01645 [Armadillidium nasatum]